MSDAFTPPIFRSPLRRLTGVQVLGCGSYAPEVIVRNEDLAAFGHDPQWILQRTGIRERRHAPPHMATSELATFAGQRCMEAAGVSRDEVDLVILSTFTPDWPVPSTSCAVQHRLGIHAPAFDLQVGCAGFVFGLVTGMAYVAAGLSQRALVIGADCTSRVININDRKTYPLFGDGAGAVLLAPGSPEQGLASYTLGSDGSGIDLLCTRMGGSRQPVTLEGVQQGQQFMHMDGKAVFKWAVRVLHDTSLAVLAECKLTPQDIDLFIPHQANLRIIDAAAEDLQIPREKVVVNLDRYGNTSAASIPMALDEVWRAGRVQRGSKLLIGGFGAGLAWGTALFRW